MSTREQSNEAKTKKITEAAIYVINRSGYQGAKTAEIAAMAGVTESAIFRQFPTKAALANKCLSICLDFQFFYSEGAIDFSMPGEKLFQVISEKHTSIYFNNPELYIFLFHAPHTPFIDEENRLRKQQLRKSIGDLVKELQDRSILKKMPYHLVLSMFFGSFSRLFREVLEGYFPPSKKDVETLATLLWETLREPSQAPT
jgi:AcrR family transcriptional regulator